MLRSLALLILAAACTGDETLTGYGAAGTWTLTELDGAAPGAPITLMLAPGEASGQAPCNRYSARQTAPYPWFDLSPIAATRRACPDLPLETSYLTALQNARFAEVAGDILILSGGGTELVFTRAPEGP